MIVPVIAITESIEQRAEAYAAAIQSAGGIPQIVNVNQALDVERILSLAQGLLLTGGADIHPNNYGREVDPAANVEAHPTRDTLELPLAKAAVERNMPVLGICRGMQALNVVLGGSLIQDLPGHRGGDRTEVFKHEIFIPPGARMTNILGVGGFMKINSTHHQGLRWAQKAPGLMVAAYSTLKDGTIEAVESPDHRWLVGVQWHPERRDEVPKVFEHLFQGFVAAAVSGPA